MDLTWGHENEKSEMYILKAIIFISHPQNFKSSGLKLNCIHYSQLGLELWSWCQSDVLTLTWPVDLTFGVRSKLTHKACCWILSRYVENCGDGGRTCPPPSERVKICKELECRCMDSEYQHNCQISSLCKPTPCSVLVVWIFHGVLGGTPPV